MFPVDCSSLKMYQLIAFTKVFQLIAFFHKVCYFIAVVSERAPADYSFFKHVPVDCSFSKSFPIFAFVSESVSADRGCFMKCSI